MLLDDLTSTLLKHTGDLTGRFWQSSVQSWIQMKFSLFNSVHSAHISPLCTVKSSAIDKIVVFAIFHEALTQSGTQNVRNELPPECQYLPSTSEGSSSAKSYCVRWCQEWFKVLNWAWGSSATDLFIPVLNTQHAAVRKGISDKHVNYCRLYETTVMFVCAVYKLRCIARSWWPHER